MRVLKAIGRFLISVWFLVPLVTLILSVCVWFFSPFIGTDAFRPFDEPFGRWVFIAILWVIALVTLLIIWLVRRHDAKRLEDDIVKGTEAAANAEDEVVAAELGELRDKMRAAIAKLKKSKVGRRSLYELPWYVMIGPPGAGKTTAIVNSGLQFPLAEDIGKSAIGGVGGTRNCDWWFTDNAVLIDTAGRYTTQDSDADADNAAWLGFLGLLKKHRIRQPINGAMIAISLSDLSLQDEQTQKGHAAAVRRRLKELRDKLGVRFPVYVLFTKADMIAGFTEYYDNLGKDEREQVWGFTLPLDKGKAKGDASPVAAFDGEFTALLTQLNTQLLDRMQGETDHQRRSLIAGFPAQVASVRGVARAFLAEVFQDSRFEDRHILRGVYFTSGTQEGTPIDRLMMGMARTFGIGRQAIGTGRGTGRSFFLTRLFNEVVFPEAGLVSADDKVELRYRWTRRAAIAATVVVAVATGGLWARSYFGNVDLMAATATKVTEYQAAAAAIPGNPVADGDVSITVPALNILRDMQVNPIPAAINPEAASPFAPEYRLTWGLYQGDGLANQTGQSYRAALNTVFLPRLLLRLEDQISSNINNPAILYDALKVYLMLGLQGPMDSAQIESWMAADWALSYPADDALRVDLAFHLQALLGQPMQEIALNGPLVEQAQGILAQMPIAQRVYTGILQTPEAVAIPQFRLTDIGGPNLEKAFVRSSGKPLNEGIAGIFSYDGFNQVFKDQALSVAETIQRDSWVLGPKVKTDQSKAALAAVTRDVLDLYYNDFIAAYEQLLGDIDVVPLSSLQQAVEVTGILSGPTSPIVNILNSVDKEARLTVDPTGVDTAQLGSDATDIVTKDAVENKASVRTRLLLDALKSAATTQGAPPPKPPGSVVEERFSWLHQLVERVEEQPSPLDNIMALLLQVNQDLNKIAFRGTSAATTGAGGESLAALQQASAQIEGPLARWSSQITTGGAGITADGTRASINAAWQQSVLPFCLQATEKLYPFDRRAAADLGIADFQKLFGPTGLIDSFMTTNLKDLIDTSSKPWKWRVVNGADLGISQAVLDQLQAADDIKSAFFPNGPAPGVAFQMTPVALDPNATEITLVIDGQNVQFAQNAGQPLPTAITWPGAVGVAQVTFNPPLNGGESTVTKDGPWGWFRLLDSAEVRATNTPDRKRVIFNVGGRIAIFQIQIGSVVNAFSLPAMSSFACPQSF